MLLCAHCSGDYSTFRRTPRWALTGKHWVEWWWKNNVIFLWLSKAPELVWYPSNSTLEKSSAHLLIITLFQADTQRKDDSSSSRFEWKCHKEEQLAVSSCALRVPVETTVSLSTFSSQTASIICLLNSFSLAIGISAVSLHPLRNGLLHSPVD